MRIGSRDTRTAILLVAMQFLFDAVVAGFASWVIGGGTKEALLIFCAIYGFLILNWIRKSAFAWLAFLVGQRQTASKQVIDYLVENKFPSPPEFVSSAEDYFEKVSDDQEVEVGVRLKAAAQLGEMRFARIGGNFQGFIRLSMILEDALVVFKRQLLDQRRKQ